MNVRTDESIKEEVRSKADIASVIGRYVKLKASGQTLKGLCPFHKEKTPSFHVNPQRGFFHCFGCGKGGDVFSFVQEIENIGFLDALKMLARETGVELREETRAASESRDKSGEVSRTDLLRIHELASDFFYRNVRSSPQAIDYFKSRGLKGETAKEFKLGFAPSGWSSLLMFFQEQQIPLSTLVKCGLAVEKENSGGYDRFRNRVIFPLHDLSGRVIAFAGRGMSDDVQPKYLNSPETLLYKKKDLLYGLYKSRQYIKDQGYCLVMEGYMDYLTLYQAGIRNGVASSGTAFTAEHGRLLQRFTTKIVLVFDGDAAGQTAAQRAVFILAPLNLDVSILVLPGDEDPDSFVKSNGPGAFLELVKEAKEWDSFIIDRAVAEHHAVTPRGKSAALSYLMPLAQSITDPIAKQKFNKELSERLGIDEKLVYRSYNNSNNNRVSENTIDPFNKKGDQYINTLEGSFLRILTTKPEFINEAVNYVAPETLTDGISGDIYSLITETYSEKGSLDSICDRTNDPEIKRLISQMLVSPALQDHIHEEFVQKVIHLRAKYLRSKIREVKLRLKNETERKGELLERLKDYSIQLKELDGIE